MSPADEVRRLMGRYPSNPDRTRDALDAALAPVSEPTAAEMAASILGQYFTADDIRDGLSNGAITVSVTESDVSEDEVMAYTGFTPAERALFRAACDVPAIEYTARQEDLLVRYEHAKNELTYGEGQS